MIVNSAPPRLPARTDGTRMGALLLVAFTALASLTLQWSTLINPDVANLTWMAEQVWGPAVYGRDLYDVCPPLCFMIYTPAVPLAKLIGVDPAIKVWLTCLACLSVAGFWQSCEERLRLPLTIVFAMFISLAFYGQFGQREHVALMLCAPYAAGYASRRGWSVSNGVMAGVGFAIKPYFLIPLAFIFLTRRRVRTEEIAIALTGALYAVTLLLFFQPYLFEFLPKGRAVYWAVRSTTDTTPLLAGLIIVPALVLAAASSPQPASRGLLAATLGFALAALIQYRGFAYHFHAAFGFFVLFLTAKAFDPRRIVAICAALLVLINATMIVRANHAWIAGERDQKAVIAALKAELDQAHSFTSFVMTSAFPNFPLVHYTTARYEGLAIFHFFAPAVRNTSRGEEASAVAAPLAIGQAIRELQRKPAVVIVLRDGSYFNREDGAFDYLAWLSRDKGFSEVWKDYTFHKYVEGYALYRRKEAASP
jgi:hypothetical protein